NTNKCFTSFTVVDSTAPTFACPAATTNSANASCQAAIPDLVTSLSAADNCTPAGSLGKSQNPAAGTPVGLGTSPITVRVWDTAGNTNTCATSFTVIDTTPPTVACPAATTNSADASCQSTIPNVLGGVIASDNCTAASSLSKSQSPAAGTPVGLGTYPITV